MRYRRSTETQRNQATERVRELMDAKRFSRARAARVVAASMGFSRNSIVGWCETAGIYARENDDDVVRLQEDLEATKLVNQRLADALGGES